MSPILRLQQLTPIASRGDFNVMLMSTASVICPTTAIPPGGDFRQFEME
jgi:hypothetical protein